MRPHPHLTLLPRPEPERKTTTCVKCGQPLVQRARGKKRMHAACRADWKERKSA